MRGYWRESVNSSLIFRCPDATRDSGCKGGTGDPCKPSLRGVYCRVCVDSWTYYDSSESVCKSCTMMKYESVVAMGLGFLLVLAAVAQCDLVVRAHREKLAHRAAVRPPDQKQLTAIYAEFFAGLNLLRKRDEKADADGGDTDGGDTDGGDTERARPYLMKQGANSRAWGARIVMLVRKVGEIALRAATSYKVRLLITFLQITCFLDEVYQLSFPSEVVQLMRQIEVCAR